MIKIYVWDRSLPNNYHSAESPIGLELSASAVVMAPSRKEAIALVERQINPKDRIGPSAHYVRMVEGMKTTKPTSETPITTPGREAVSRILFLSIGAHYNDTKPLKNPLSK